MSDHHDGPINGTEPELPNETRKDEMIPHLTVVRQITYQGNKPAILKVLEAALPDGLFILATPGGTPVGTIKVQTAEPEEIVPEWLGVVKADLIAKAQQRAQQQGPTILNPHTLKPVRQH